MQCIEQLRGQGVGDEAALTRRLLLEYDAGNRELLHSHTRQLRVDALRDRLKRSDPYRVLSGYTGRSDPHRVLLRFYRDIRSL